MTDERYVLITPARNEGAFIEKTIQSVINQTVLPLKWVIVSDGSTDETDSIVANYAGKWDFIELLRVRGDSSRNFGSKVRAIQRGCELLAGKEYGFIGILDSDISLGPDYYGRILKRFAEDGRLGIAGGFIHEEEQGEYISRKFNNVGSVPNAIQLFRRECFDKIGGFIPLQYGGEDWYAEVMARRLGWRVESFPDIKVLHHRRTLGAEGQLRGGYRQGLMDYSLGSGKVFEVIKCLTRVRTKPYGLYAASRLAGFVAACVKREERPVSDDFVKHLRKEQSEKIANMFRNISIFSAWREK